VLAAADGRNSSVARLLGLLPPARRDRAARQVHVPAHGAWRGSIGLLLSRHGYAGVAPVDDSMLNICLVARPEQHEALLAEMTSRLPLAADGAWRSLAPLARRPSAPAPRPGLFLLGDAARVVEPFTGEGIYYAMRSAQLAAAALLDAPDPRDAARRYRADHTRLYRGRLWPNLLARCCVEHPAAGDAILHIGRLFPSVLRGLSSKVTRVRRPL
jgi:flavin-dependent dehydrogenase